MNSDEKGHEKILEGKFKGCHFDKEKKTTTNHKLS